MHDVTAIVAVRNEDAYLANCLRHLAAEGVAFAILDNDSTDATPSIYRSPEFASGLVDVVRLPFDGSFRLSDILRTITELIERLETDWVVRVDADEIMHSYRAGETLADALRRLGAEGWNAIDFDEFVFLPIEHDYVTDAAGQQPLELYYFFQPHTPRLMRAWRRSYGFTMVEHAGHRLSGPNLRLAPERLALRHYMFRSRSHAFEKYTTRRFPEDELAAGWHRARANQPREAFELPDASALKRLAEPGARDLDRSDPWAQHYWRRGH